MRQLRLSLAETGLSAMAMHLGTVLAVVAALVAVTTGGAGAASAIVVLTLSRECFRPVQDLGTNWHAGYLGLIAVDGLNRLLSLPPVPSGDHDSPAVAGAVGVRSVSYRYPCAETGVTGLSLRIEPGETVAVIGPSGSGKSTLARLLERDFDPDAGSITVDEVTSALDAGTERRVVDALAAATAGRTVVIIAHRETACIHATRWIGLRDGRITATGCGAPTGSQFTSGVAR